MAKLKLPFELEKPSSNEYVTQASEIGYDGEPLNQVLHATREAITNFFIDDTSGDICFTDANGYIIFKLSSNGAEAKQFRVLNSSGELIGTIDSAFFQAVLKSSDIINNLTSSATNKPLSAKQGKILKELIESSISNLLIIDDERSDTDFIDANNNIIAKINADGVSSVAFLVKNSQGQTVGAINQAFFSQFAGLMLLNSHIVYDNGTFLFKDNNNNVIFSVSPTETKLNSLVLTDDDKFVVIDNKGRIAFKVDADGIDAKAIGDNLLAAIRNGIGIIASKPKMIVLGSSSVAGAGSDQKRNLSYVLDFLEDKGIDTSLFDDSVNGVVPFGTILQDIIGSDNISIVNLGVGGENILSVSARYGNYPALIPQDIVLPAGTSTVMIADETSSKNLLSSYDKTSAVKVLLQGGLYQINPCIVEGIECELSETHDSGYTNVKYYLKRKTAGDRQVTIPAMTPIIPANAKLNRRPDFAIICNWYNAGYGTVDNLVEMVRQTAENIGCKDYIVLEKYAATAAQGLERETALLKAFGDRYLNFRQYIATNALYDIGITPTTDADFTAEQLDHGVKSDTYQMSVGEIPSSFWRYVYGVDGSTQNDKAHMNRCGYALLAYKLYERMLTLGMISKD